MKSGASGSTADSIRRLSFPVVELDPPATSDRIDDGGPSAGASLALQSLYANDAVKHPLAHLPHTPNLSILNLISMTLTLTLTTIGKTKWTQLHLLDTMRLAVRP
jgi:hypothetical protein